MTRANVIPAGARTVPVADDIDASMPAAHAAASALRMKVLDLVTPAFLISARHLPLGRR